MYASLFELAALLVKYARSKR